MASVSQPLDKRLESMPSQGDQLTAANSNNGGVTTSFSMGPSPANAAMNRRRQRSEVLMFDQRDKDSQPIFNNYASCGN